MSEEHDLSEHDLEFDEENPVLHQQRAADSQDFIIELLCSYRAKLLCQDFSEEAAEQMVVAYHFSLCG
jgi:hypothetical protein